MKYYRVQRMRCYEYSFNIMLKDLISLQLLCKTLRCDLKSRTINSILRRCIIQKMHTNA